MKRGRWHMILTLWGVYRRWRKQPHLRLGQFIFNYTTTRSKPKGTPIFWMEDVEWHEGWHVDDR